MTVSDTDEPPPDWRASFERAPLRVRVSVGAAIVVLLLAMGTTVLIGMLRPGAPAVEEVSAVADTVEDQPIYVHVRGAVVSPGLHRLDPGDRIIDAIAAAGGFTEEADDSALNLARAVTDGEQVSVPAQGEVDEVSPGESADGRVNLNTADVAALDTLPRIGPALAQRIIEWREQNGSFTSVDQLTDVPGIGDKMLESLRPMVTT